MAQVILERLRRRARERADMVGSTFITDTVDSLDSWINEGAQKLHDLLIQAYGNDYVESSYTFNTVNGTAEYELPEDFYKLMSVEVQIDDSNFLTLKPYNRAERNAYRNAPRGWSSSARYRLQGNNILLMPIPAEIRAVTIAYAPVLQVDDGSPIPANTLVNTNDSINFPNGWERYVVLYAAKIAMDKEESDSSRVNAALEKEEADLKQLIENRDAGIPHSAVDLDVLDDEFLGWRW